MLNFEILAGVYLAIVQTGIKYGASGVSKFVLLSKIFESIPIKAKVSHRFSYK